jgi:hypothetical protein
MRKLIPYLFIIILVPAIGLAETGSGGRAGAFRDLSLGGRPSALGGAYTALASGGIGHLFNPAGPALEHQFDVALSYRVMKLDRRLGYASFTIPAKENACLSFSWIYAGTKALDSRDDQGYIIPGQSISYAENLVSVNFAKQFAPRFYLGGKAFYAQNSIANINAYTVGVDAGAMYKMNMSKTAFGKIFPLLQFGLAAQNFGATYRWNTAKYWENHGTTQGATVDEKFPLIFRGGAAAIKLDNYLLTTDLEISTASRMVTHIGGEYTIARLLSLRAGLDDLHPTFGIGLFRKLDRFGVWIDLSYLTDKVGEGNDFMASFDLVF